MKIVCKRDLRAANILDLFIKDKIYGTNEVNERYLVVRCEQDYNIRVTLGTNHNGIFFNRYFISLEVQHDTRTIL